MKQPVTFYSEGMKLVGDLYLPDGLKAGERRPGVLLCHGYTGVKDLYLPDNARVLNERGYVVLTFDYKGWGDSEGTRSRLAPMSRVADCQNALTFLGAQDTVDEDRLGIYGTSYGGSTVIWVAALDQRVKACVSVVGVGDGRDWMRSVRRPDEFVDLLERSKQDRIRRVVTGQSEYVARDEVPLPDRQSAGLAAAARKNNPAAVGTIPLEYIDETLQFHSDWVVHRIAPRPLLCIAAGDDRLVPPENFRACFDKAGEPKRWVSLAGVGHYQVYTGEPFDQIMRETCAWYGEWL